MGEDQQQQQQYTLVFGMVMARAVLAGSELLAESGMPGSVVSGRPWTNPYQ